MTMSWIGIRRPFLPSDAVGRRMEYVALYVIWDVCYAKAVSSYLVLQQCNKRKVVDEKLYLLRLLCFTCFRPFLLLSDDLRNEFSQIASDDG